MMNSTHNTNILKYTMISLLFVFMNTLMQAQGAFSVSFFNKDSSFSSTITLLEHQKTINPIHINWNDYNTYTDDSILKDKKVKLKFKIMTRGAVRKYVLRQSLHPDFDSVVLSTLRDIRFSEAIPQEKFNAPVWLTFHLTVDLG